jgi:uncharacterized protein YegP (UPF0339 family)
MTGVVSTIVADADDKEGYVPAKFEIKKGPTGKFRFNLISTNGQVIATSQAYERKAACVAGVASIQKLAAGAKVEDLTVPAAKPAVAKPAAKKPAAKAVAKKPAAKAVAKKPAAKKPAAKRPAAKKPAARK